MKTTSRRMIISLSLLLMLLAQLVVSAVPANARPAAAPAAQELQPPPPGCGRGITYTQERVRYANGGGEYYAFRDRCQADALVTRIREQANQAGFCTAAGTVLGVAGLALAIPGGQLPAGVIAAGGIIMTGTCSALAVQFNSLANKVQQANQRCGELGIIFDFSVKRPVYAIEAVAKMSNFRCQPNTQPFSDLGGIELAGMVPKVDYTFVVDTTGSMGSSIQSVKTSLSQILGAISDTGVDWRVAVVQFRDQGDAFVSKVEIGFSSDKAAITSAINRLGAEGGGDTPEAVYSGLMTAIKLPWRDDAKRQIILMGDASPKDPEPGTGYTQTSVVNAANAGGIAGTQRIGLAKPAAGLGTPININTVIVGGDTAARTAFQALADRTAGKLFSGDVVQAFLSAIALVVPPAPKIINLALNKPAVNYIASNDQPTRVAGRAVDGNTDGNVWGNSVSSTHFQNEASWTVDLGSSRWIDDIKIWKRTDCCMIQMSDYYIFVSEQPFSANSVSSSLSQLGVTNIFRAGWSTAPADTFAIGRTGRYVRIQLKGANVLSLAEVQLMGAQ